MKHPLYGSCLFFMSTTYLDPLTRMASWLVSNLTRDGVVYQAYTHQTEFKQKLDSLVLRSKLNRMIIGLKLETFTSLFLKKAVAERIWVQVRAYWRSLVRVFSYRNSGLTYTGCITIPPKYFNLIILEDVLLAVRLRTWFSCRNSEFF